MLGGELEYRRGNIELDFEHLRKSPDLDDGLRYAEPWAWMQPARHAYAACSIACADDRTAFSIGRGENLYR
ncbi:hypothetical protein H9Q71_014474 [Fusarium xylarioides]|nr:hypothetical protein H9Q71_014474 [Fusarium xylarioides]